MQALGKAALTAVATSVLVSIANAWPGRDASARAQFQRENPCPANGRKAGACHGYVIDHIKPLCAGGADDPSNMQWQTVADAKVKDREERRMCRK